MCNIAPVQNWLIASLAATVASFGAVASAIVATNSFWGAGGSPILMIIAGAMAGLAILFLSLAINALNTFCQCLQGRCANPCSNLLQTLQAIKAVLGAQALACFAAAGIAWIPWVGAAPMYVIITALVVLIVLLTIAFVLLNTLSNCAQAAPAGSGPGPGPGGIPT